MFKAGDERQYPGYMIAERRDNPLVFPPAGGFDVHIVHVAGRDAFEEEIRTGFYGAKSLERCGFIHCSDLDTCYLVAPNFRNDREEKLIPDSGGNGKRREF